MSRAMLVHLLGVFRRKRSTRRCPLPAFDAVGLGETPRLLLVTHFFPAHGGGLEKVAEKIAVGLSDRGFRICWFSSATDAPPDLGRDSISIVQVPTNNSVERLTQLPYPLWSLRSIPRLWREIGRSDAVHVHEHLYFPSLITVAMAHLRRRPVIVTQHMGALVLGSRLTTMLYAFGARTLGLVIFSSVARTVFISANVREFFKLESSSRAQIIFNGLDTHNFRYAEEHERRSIRARLGLSLDKRIVLFVGRFVRKKGIHRIEEMAMRLPEVLWIFVGSGPETPKSSLPNILIAGRIEHERLPLFYQAADLLILPSSGEGFPLVVQEALCCGTGVVSTDEVANACPDASSLIISRPVPRDDDDADAWADTVRNVLSDSRYLDSRARRAQAARDLWSWELCTARYSELIHEILLKRHDAQAK